jgi:hypothetical protein
VNDRGVLQCKCERHLNDVVVAVSRAAATSAVLVPASPLLKCRATAQCRVAAKRASAERFSRSLSNKVAGSQMDCKPWMKAPSSVSGRSGSAAEWSGRRSGRAASDQLRWRQDAPRRCRSSNSKSVVRSSSFKRRPAKQIAGPGTRLRANQSIPRRWTTTRMGLQEKLMTFCQVGAPRSALARRHLTAMRPTDDTGQIMRKTYCFFWG